MNETQKVRREIASQCRIRDEIPEHVPTTLARELANHYPAEVQRQSDRLASLSAELLRRERYVAGEERATRVRQEREYRDRVERLQTHLAAAHQQCAELERRAVDRAIDVCSHLDAIVERVKRFRNRSRASKRSLVADIVALTQACLAALPDRPAARGNA